MPVYEFHCGSCGFIFEKLLFYNDIGEVLCPKCLASAKRVMSTFSISIPDEACGKLPKGEQRELCTECKEGGGACPFAA